MVIGVRSKTCVSSIYVSIAQYSGRCRKYVVYIFVVRRGAPPSNCDITKALWREYHNENGGLRKHCAYDKNNLAIDVTSFWRTKAFVTSHFAVGPLTDFLVKAQLLDRDGNFICR